MDRHKTATPSGFWAKARDMQPRLQRLAILYGGLFLLMSVVITFMTPGLAYGAKGVVGGDFLAFYTAGDMTLQGRALDAYEFEAFDTALQTRVENEHLGMMWQYPPLMFFLVGLLALVPYKLSLWLWMASTAAVFAWALIRILSSVAPARDARWMAGAVILTSPLCLMVVTSGQISLLTGALLMLAVFRPRQDWWIAGLAAGLLTVKPQLGVLIPLVYLVAGAWRAFAVAALTAVALHAISILVFGPESLSAFLNAVVRLQSDVAGSGTHTPPENMTTLFAQLRDWGVPSSPAMAAHLALAACVVAGVLWLWRRHARDEDRAIELAALVGAGSLLVTPYAYAYEMVALTPAAIWLAYRPGRLAGAALGLLIAGWLILTVRGVLPLDVLIQMPFLISVSAFALIIWAARPSTKGASIAALS